MSHPSDSNDKRTVVDEGTSFKGTLSSSCPIDVRGRIEGDLSTPTLTISKSGAVHGRVKVGSVRSEGEIAGEFEADHVELAGSVKDNTVIRARSLEVRLSSERGRLQVIFGDCELSVGDEPSEHVALPVEAEQALAPVVHQDVEVVPDAPAELVASPSAAAENEVVAVAEIAPAANEAAADLPRTHEASMAASAEAAELEDEEDEAQAGHADTVEPRPRRRGRKAKNGAGDDAPLTGWSQPPSQPPPAS